MLYRKNDAVLDFDLAKVIEQSRENPVFYVQYGHARGHSVFRNAREVIPDLPNETEARSAFLGDAAVERLTDPSELDLLRRLALYPRMIEAASTSKMMKSMPVVRYLTGKRSFGASISSMPHS